MHANSVSLSLPFPLVWSPVPEEFMYNPISRSYGEPQKRPEVQNATIEFIAPSEYMVPPPVSYCIISSILYYSIDEVPSWGLKDYSVSLMYKKGL